MRIQELDSLRGLAIVGVLSVHALVHCEGYDVIDPPVNILYTLLALAGRIGVPAFILISGFFLTRAELSDENILSVVRSRILRILPPYLIWSTIYYFITYLFFQTEIPTRHFAVIFLEKLATGTVSWHLYFIYLLMQYYCLAAIGVCRRGNTSKRELLFFTTLQIGFISLCYFCALQQAVTGMPLEKPLYYFQAYRLSVFPMYIGYFLLGRWLGANYDAVLAAVSRKRTFFFMIGILGTIVSFGEVYWFRAIHTDGSLLPADWMIGTNLFVIGTLGILMPALKKVKEGYGKDVLSRFAAWSFVIYLLHEPLMEHIGTLLHDVLYDFPGSQLFICILMIGITPLLCRLAFAMTSIVLAKKWVRIVFG